MLRWIIKVFWPANIDHKCTKKLAKTHLKFVVFQIVNIRKDCLSNLSKIRKTWKTYQLASIQIFIVWIILNMGLYYYLHIFSVQ